MNECIGRLRGTMGDNAMKFSRKPNRIYTIMDFEDGEEIELSHYSSVPSSKEKGCAFYRSKKNGRTMLLTPDDIDYCNTLNQQEGSS